MKTKKGISLTRQVSLLLGLLIVLTLAAVVMSMASFLRTPVAIVLLIVFLIAAAALLLFVRQISRSLRQLTDVMNHISSGKRGALRERIPIDDKHAFRCREVDEIAQAFNEMLEETNRLNHNILNNCERMFELEVLNRRTEISFLRSQINPHFLYNTLTLICGMASDGQNSGIIEVAGALSRIYRYSVKGQSTVALREELAIVEAYVMIQKTRFEDRFIVETSYAENTLDAMLPNMLLQPLVENAISHGLERLVHKGTLRIESYVEPDSGRLCLRVTDTGEGMDEETLAAVRTRLSHAASDHTANHEGLWGERTGDSRHGVGLYNVASRVYLTYGGESSLSIDSSPGCGTSVLLKMPLIKY
jgi:two-component system sensor histidine kinase YesM